MRGDSGEADEGELRDLERYNQAIPSISRLATLDHRICQRKEVAGGAVAKWIDAGFELGNHTYSHAEFKQVSLEEMQDETIRGGVVTRSLLIGRYFRYPSFKSIPKSRTNCLDFRKGGATVRVA